MQGYLEGMLRLVKRQWLLQPIRSGPSQCTSMQLTTGSESEQRESDK